MGEVYRARDPRLGREVAIKVLPGVFSADADRLRRFEQEASAAGVLNHPNIIAVYDIGEPRTARPTSSRSCSRARRCASARGRPLAQRKAIELRDADRPRPRRRAREGHRPPGPEAREPLPHQGRPRQDPRLRPRQAHAEPARARAATNLPTDDQRAPSPASSSARSATCRPSRSAASPPTRAPDIFSFGAILYEMLSGKRAFHGDSAADTMSAILEEDPPDLSVTQPEHPARRLERIVRHCLEKSPEQRFHSAHDLGVRSRGALRDVAGRPRCRLRPPTAPAHAGRSARPRRARRRGGRVLRPARRGARRMPPDSRARTFRPAHEPLRRRERRRRSRRTARPSRSSTAPGARPTSGSSARAGGTRST